MAKKPDCPPTAEAISRWENEGGSSQKRLKRPRDPVQLGKLVGDILTGQVEDRVEDKRNPAAVEMGSKGGAARASALSARKRKEIAKKAAEARWRGGTKKSRTR